MSSDLMIGGALDGARSAPRSQPPTVGGPPGAPRRQDPAAGGRAEAAAVDREKLDSAVSAIKDYVQNISRDLEFTVDEELNRVIIKVYDAESQEMIRQIPAEEVLNAARQLHKVQGLIFSSKA
ncbi:MAG TPA: flagellar protein FlaG [Gammaproteobacteria bacterium]|nr:flagellar protein FlaG [Gammaproteobacteria bacterium]